MNREQNTKKIVDLKPIHQDNWHTCSRLEVTEEQRRVFPVPAVYWLAEAAYCGYVPLAVCVNEEIVGLAVYAVDPEDGSYWIMAFMIDRRFQNRGLGRAGMMELIRYIKGKHHCDKIVLGHRPQNERAASLYASLGFKETERNDREIVRQLLFSS